MVNKVDEIQGGVLANKCDILVITESHDGSHRKSWMTLLRCQAIYAHF
jgi:hypothetical protein